MHATRGIRARRVTVAAALALSLVLALTAMGEGRANASGEASACDELAEYEFDDAVVNSAVLVEGEVNLPSGLVSEIPAFCRVDLTVQPAIHVETWLPTNWNERLMGTIVGGWAGVLNYGGMVSAVREGFAAVSTDTGHVAGDPDWMLDEGGDLDRGLVEDYAHRAGHEMTVKAKELVQAYYGRATIYDYYSGCSGGGRQGVALAQLYPDDYDGILAAAPAMYIPQFLTSDMWPQLSRLAHEGLSPCQLSNIHEAVVEACDDLDGLEDGLVDDPRRCDFDPASLTCHTDDATCDCLTPEQVELVREVYEGPVDSNGESLWYGFDRGSEPFWSGIPLGPQPFGPAVEFFRYMVHQDSSWQWQDFDAEADLDLALEQVGELLQTDDPDLRRFADAGGKLLMWHGWADQIIPAQGSVRYMDAVRREMGTHYADATARLFLVPGTAHCGGGDAPNSFDALLPLVDWVEQGEAPERIVATQRDEDGATVRTRPLCAYPLVSRHDGSGPVDEAASFDCELTGVDRADQASMFGPGLDGRNRARRAEHGSG